MILISMSYTKSNALQPTDVLSEVFIQAQVVALLFVSKKISH